MNKGLICEIYESKDIGNCSNGGISSTNKEVLVVMKEGEGQVFEEDEKRPTVKIVRRIIDGEEYVHAEPINAPEGIGWMMGGSFIYSCDSRFRNYVNEYPIALHDRQETSEQNRLLSI